MTLKKKQELIGETVSKAKERVLSLPDDEYFKTILKVADRSLAAEEGIVYFNEKDLHRMTEDFKDQLLKLAEEKGGKLEISTEPRKLDGGFVLQYGGIEENCSIDAIFATEYEFTGYRTEGDLLNKIPIDVIRIQSLSSFRDEGL